MKRFISAAICMAMVFCAVMALAIPSGAKEPDPVAVDPVEAGGSSASYTAINGTVTGQINIKNNTAGTITVTGVSSVSAILKLTKPTAASLADPKLTIEAGKTYAIPFSASTDAAYPANTYDCPFEVAYTDANGDGGFASFTLSVVIDAKPATDSPVPTVIISPTDGAGNAIAAPRGNYGKGVSMTLPLFIACGHIYDLRVTPVISDNLDSWPFEINMVDYTIYSPGSHQPGEVIMFRYDLTIGKKVTAGVKKVDFDVFFRDANDPTHELQKTTLSLYLTVVKGYTAPDATDPETPAAASEPKVIIESYSISSDRLFAGDQFEVTLNIRNTSADTDIKNITVRVADATNVVLPANNGSNTIYISEIARESTHTEKIALQTAPDAEARAYTLTVDIAYEAAKTAAQYTAQENITLPIAQKIRMKIGEPSFYDEAWVGQNCSGYFTINNMGKSTIYNVTAEVEGDGLSLAESYFGGNLASGSTLNVDFMLLCEMAGEIQGNMVVQYEDVYGVQAEERMPFTLYVNEQMMEEYPSEGGDMYGMDDPYGDVFMEEQPTGMPVWAWIAIGVAAAGGITALVIVLVKKKNGRRASR